MESGKLKMHVKNGNITEGGFSVRLVSMMIVDICKTGKCYFEINSPLALEKVIMHV